MSPVERKLVQPGQSKEASVWMYFQHHDVALEGRPPMNTDVLWCCTSVPKAGSVNPDNHLTV